jgi:hypothetical protein
MRVQSAVPHGTLMQPTCRSVTLVSPLIFYLGTYNNNSPGTFRWHLIQAIVILDMKFHVKGGICWTVSGPVFHVDTVNSEIYETGCCSHTTTAVHVGKLAIDAVIVFSGKWVLQNSDQIASL